MNILDAISDPKLFAPWFSGPTWGAWMTFLKVLFALDLDEDDCLVYTRHTKRIERSRKPFREAWVCAGRRGGKSIIAALLAVFTACFRDHRQHLTPGEVGVVAVIASDRSQARIVLRYVKGFLEIPALKSMIMVEKQESVELSVNGVPIVIEVHTASWRSTRGFTYVAVVADEIAFWRSDDAAANPDKEIVAAVRPGLATIPDSLLLCISSPYARRGLLFETWQRHFGSDDSDVLVWQATSRDMNPSLPQAIVDRALEEDESSARAEYLAEFRDDVESFVRLEAVWECVVAGRKEPRKPTGMIEYFCFVDPAGGGGQDSMTLAIAHKNHGTGKAVLDLTREVKPPFAPSAVVREFARLARRFRCSTVVGDAYAGEFCREHFRSNGLNYRTSALHRSDLYAELLPAINSGLIELPDDPRLIAQFVGLERRVGRSGRDSIDHSPGSHDDLANAAAGALVAALHPSAVARGLVCQLF